MMNVAFDVEKNIAILRPEGVLTKADFESAARIIDGYINNGTGPEALVLVTESFPGWEDFGAMLEHFTFIKDHHNVVGKIAFVTNIAIASLFEKVASHFVAAQIKSFAFAELLEAKEWAAS
jgi:hypothetical protein